jgi:hypothetical protein
MMLASGQVCYGCSKAGTSPLWCSYFWSHMAHGSLHTSVLTPPSDSPLHRSGSSGSCASEAHAANREGEEALAGASVGLWRRSRRNKSMGRADWKAHPIIRSGLCRQKYGI